MVEPTAAGVVQGNGQFYENSPVTPPGEAAAVVAADGGLTMPDPMDEVPRNAQETTWQRLYRLEVGLDNVRERIRNQEQQASEARTELWRQIDRRFNEVEARLKETATKEELKREMRPVTVSMGAFGQIVVYALCAIVGAVITTWIVSQGP